MAEDCLFCKIIAGEIPAKKIMEDDDVVVFADIAPQAPLHALVVPKRHIRCLADLVESDDALVGKMHRAAGRVVKESGHEDYRTVFNCGEEAGQSVWHLHLHVLAGRPMRWPPG